MPTGKVLRFDEVRGYGFIAPDAGGEDIFMHANSLQGEKAEFASGVAVEFQLREDERGSKAYGVRVLREPRPPGDGVARAVAEPRAVADGAAAPVADLPDDDLLDVLTSKDFAAELTEVLLDADPSLTAAQIVRVRQRLVELATRHGWVEG